MIEQVLNVSQTTVLQEAWNRGQDITVHGWIFGLDNGLTQDLRISISARDGLQEIYDEAIGQLETPALYEKAGLTA